MVFTQYENSRLEYIRFVEFRSIDEYDPDELLKYEKHYPWALPLMETLQLFIFPTA